MLVGLLVIELKMRVNRSPILYFVLIHFQLIVQARVYEELDTIFGDSNRQCTFQDTLEMKYLERVIMETLRLFPPVPLIARRLNEEVKIGKLFRFKYIIKTITIIIILL